MQVKEEKEKLFPSKVQNKDKKMINISSFKNDFNKNVKKTKTNKNHIKPQL